jgi:hypothetical protein
MELVRVSSALSYYSDFSAIKPDVLAAAAARGTRVHAAIASYLTGAFSVPELLPGEDLMFESLVLWVDAMVAEVIDVEPELKSIDLGYVGHPDLIARLKNRSLAVVDFKTPQNEAMGWPIQIAAYRQLVAEKYLEAPDGYAVSPRPDGKIARAFLYGKNPLHFNVFLSALNCHRYFNQKKG